MVIICKNLQIETAFCAKMFSKWFDLFSKKEKSPVRGDFPKSAALRGDCKRLSKRACDYKAW